MTSTTRGLSIPIRIRPAAAAIRPSWWARLARSFRCTGPMTTDPAAVRREAQRLRQAENQYATMRALGL